MLMIEKLATRYFAGKASVQAGGTVVTPHGAVWAGNIWGDDLFFLPSQPLVPPQRIEQINEDGTAQLAYPWPGVDAVEADYEIRYVGIIERSTAQSRKVMEELGSFPSWFLALAGLTGEANKLPYLTGASTAALADLSPFMREVLAASNGVGLWTGIGADGGISGNNGWARLPNGIIVQWGRTTGTGNVTGAFPTAFPSNCFVTVVTMENIPSAADGQALAATMAHTSLSAFAINKRLLLQNYVGTAGETARWLAIGN